MISAIPFHPAQKVAKNTLGRTQSAKAFGMRLTRTEQFEKELADQINNKTK